MMVDALVYDLEDIVHVDWSTEDSRALNEHVQTTLDVDDSAFTPRLLASTPSENSLANAPTDCDGMGSNSNFKDNEAIHDNDKQLTNNPLHNLLITAMTQSAMEQFELVTYCELFQSASATEQDSFDPCIKPFIENDSDKSPLHQQTTSPVFSALPDDFQSLTTPSEYETLPSTAHSNDTMESNSSFVHDIGTDMTSVSSITEMDIEEFETNSDMEYTESTLELVSAVQTAQLVNVDTISGPDCAPLECLDGCDTMAAVNTCDAFAESSQDTCKSSASSFTYEHAVTPTKTVNTAENLVHNVNPTIATCSSKVVNMAREKQTRLLYSVVAVLEMISSKARFASSAINNIKEALIYTVDLVVSDTDFGYFVYMLAILVITLCVSNGNSTLMFKKHITIDDMNSIVSSTEFSANMEVFICGQIADPVCSAALSAQRLESVQLPPNDTHKDTVDTKIFKSHQSANVDPVDVFSIYRPRRLRAAPTVPVLLDETNSYLYGFDQALMPSHRASFKKSVIKQAMILGNSVKCATNDIISMLESLHPTLKSFFPLLPPCHSTHETDYVNQLSHQAQSGTTFDVHQKYSTYGDQTIQILGFKVSAESVLALVPIYLQSKALSQFVRSLFNVTSPIIEQTRRKLLTIKGNFKDKVIKVSRRIAHMVQRFGILISMPK
ncbi:hypothetical protein O5D80_007853 [Batrachochytrium dendrobatidis]|nr:hypothetical protein O5D80_007853 [Batrachochytrium dendrobatidis]